MIKKYSILMPLYIKDNPDWLSISLDSIINQTIPPDEIVIVCDGELNNELNTTLENYEMNFPGLFSVYRFNKNRGLGLTLSDGIKLCRNELIARMDADDFSIIDRCEKQLAVFENNPDFDVVGCNVDEFVDNIDNIVSHVFLPESQEDIVKFAKRRCPIRHPALMYKKSSVLRAGNYADYRHAQDYNLIVRMILSGSTIYNIQETLVYMRVSPNFYQRRGGWEQAKLVLKLKKEFLDLGFYSPLDFCISGIGNALVALLPNKLRSVFYSMLLRD